MTEWLKTGMFADETTPSIRSSKAKKVVDELADHALTLSHARHIDYARAEEIGLKVTELEKDDKFQDAFLTVHHLCIQSLSDSQTVKLIENDKGVAFIQGVAMSPLVQPVDDQGYPGIRARREPRQPGRL